MTEIRPHYNTEIFLLIAAIIGFLLLIPNPLVVRVGGSIYGGANATLQIIIINIFTLIFGSSLIVIRKLKFPKASSELSVKLGFRQVVSGILMILAIALVLPIFIHLLPIAFAGYGDVQVSVGTYLSLIYFALILAANIFGIIEYRQLAKQSEMPEE